MASLFDVLGVVFGVVGVISAVPIVMQWMENRLPPAHLARFDGIAADAEALLEALRQDDSPLDEERLCSFRERLSSLWVRVQKARLQTYRAATWKEQVRSGFASGLSGEIASLCEEAIQLRAMIAAAALVDHEPDMFIPADAPLPAGSRSRERSTEPALRSALRAKPSNSPPPPYSTAEIGRGHAAASVDQLPSGEVTSSRLQALRRVRSLPALYAAMVWASRVPPNVLDGDDSGLRRRRRDKKVHFALPDIISNGNHTDNYDD
ncbi:hypothetical protein C8Q79DRAFT_1008642 [Trametes meyenii]|nr:hypothetical protein C8Q79DRAFT_1008642 [Trametes meyenii]